MNMGRHYHGGSYRILSESEITEIHESTLTVLEKVGFELTYEPMLELLKRKGAKVNLDNNRVYLNRELIWRCIKQAPAEFVFYGREEGKEIIVGGKHVHFGTGGLALNVLDLNREKKRSTSNDIADIARLVEKLENIEFYIIPVYPSDAPSDTIDVNSFYPALKYSSKPVMGGVFSREGLDAVVDIAARLAGGMEKLVKRPFVGFITSIISPLKLSADQAEYLMAVAQYGLPLVTSTAPAAGATAPVTLAGTLVQQNAEALIGVVLSQLVNPGTPVFYSAVPVTMDMRNMSFLMGSIEGALMNAAISQMAHFYRVPSYITVGATDSKVPDAQAAQESAMSSMLAALAGGNYIHEAAGMLEGLLTASYAKYVIDNDILGACLRTLRGIEINRDTLAVDVIASVGPGGNFLTEEHTLQYMRTELYSPRVSDRQGYSGWLDAGAKDSWKQADEAAAVILSESDNTYISEQLDKKIRSDYPEIVCKK